MGNFSRFRCSNGWLCRRGSARIAGIPNRGLRLPCPSPIHGPEGYPVLRIISVLIPWTTLLAGLTACGPRDALVTVRAERGPLPVVSYESGEIQAVQTRMVRPPLEWESDLIITAMVPEGAVVKTGDEVMRLDASALGRRLDETRDNLATVETQRTGIVANQGSRRGALENAVQTAILSRDQADLQRQKLRFESRSRQQDAQLAFDRSVVALGEAQAKLLAQAVLDSLELAKADLEAGAVRSEFSGLKGRIAGMSIRAPLDGMVVYRGREDGEARGAKPRVGDTVQPWQPLFEIPDLDSMQVEFQVHEADRQRFVVGMPLTVRLEAYPESAFTGRISELAVLATETEKDSGVRGFVARGPLEPSDPRLRPGMTAVVEVDLGGLAEAVFVPRAAVAEQDGAPVVFPRAEWPRPRSVRLGVATASAVEILEGVEAGAELVVPSSALPDGIRPLGYARHFAKEGS